MAYLWLKAFHIIAVVSWMAGLLYLPRLFVYHAAGGADAGASETFKIMEFRLLWMIATPAMVASWGLGLALLAVTDQADGGFWLPAKIGAVLLLTGFHGLLVKWTRDFAQDRNGHSPRFFRLVNEVPTVLLVVIVVLVVVKPFS